MADYFSYASLFAHASKPKAKVAIAQLNIHENLNLLAVPSKPPFVNIVANSCQILDFPTTSDGKISSTTTTPINKDGYISIKVDEDAYNVCIASCKNSLIRRLILAKGEMPWKLHDLKKKLTFLWNVKHPWKFVSLSKGFYLIQLPSEDDCNVIWGRGFSCFEARYFLVAKVDSRLRPSDIEIYRYSSMGGSCF